MSITASVTIILARESVRESWWPKYLARIILNHSSWSQFVAASSLGDEVLDGDITRQLGLRYKRVPPLLQLLGHLAQLRPARPRPRPRIRSLRAAADSFT